jgi:hypothetical protein
VVEAFGRSNLIIRVRTDKAATRYLYFCSLSQQIAGTEFMKGKVKGMTNRSFVLEFCRLRQLQRFIQSQFQREAKDTTAVVDVFRFSWSAGRENREGLYFWFFFF